MRDSFQFKAGVKLVVSPQAIRTMFNSKHATEFPGTPKVLLVTRHKDGTAEFANPGNSCGKNTWGCHVFVPAEVRAGSTIEIEWTDKKETVLEGGKKRTTYSACARLVA